MSENIKNYEEYLEDGCDLCHRDMETSSHHLIPKQIHSKNWAKKMFSRIEMRERKADLCNDCHTFLHYTFKHSELGKTFNTIEKLLNNDKVVKFITWVKKQTKKAKR